MGIIYRATNIVNNKVYIGKTILPLRERMWQHHQYSFRKTKKQKTYFHSAIQKHGKDSFKWDILEEVDDNNQLNEKETFWILKLNANDKLYGYNLTTGGDGGNIIAQLPNAKAILAKQKKAASKASKARKGIKTGKVLDNWIAKYGEEQAKIMYEDFFKRRSEISIRTKLGRKYSEEHRAAISKSLKGKKLSPERIEKLKLKEQRKWSENEVRQIINFYTVENKSLKFLAKYFKSSKPTIKKLLLKNNIEIKIRKNQYI